MRTGATFARGSCGALKWMALLGVVLALGVGQASAQVTLDVAEEVSEGSVVDVKVLARANFAAGQPTADATIEVDFSATPLAGANQAETADYSLPGSVTLTFKKRSATAPADYLDATGTARLRIREDPGDAEDEKFTLDYTVTDTGSTGISTASTPKQITIIDAQTQEFMLVDAPIGAVKEGATIPPMTVEPRYTIGSMSYTVGVRLVDPAKVASALTPTSSFTLTQASPSQAVNLTLKADDGNTDQDQVTIEVVAGTFGNTTVHDTAQITINDKTPAVTSTAVTFMPAMQDPITVVAGMAMTPMQLPKASGGTGPYTYMATGLPTGLVVSPTTGMLSGTPPTMAAPAMTVTYTATDSATPAATASLMFHITVSATGVTAKSTTEIMTAVEAAQMAADSDGDRRWTPEDDPAIVPLAALFNGLPEMFDAEAMSSTAHVQASILASSGLMRASNPAVALRPVSAGMANVTVTVAGVSATLPSVMVASAATGTGSIRYITGVSVPGSQIREGGQAQATVYLNAPVRQGSIFKAHLRLVGQMHTRERGIVTLLAYSPPYRTVGGVRVPLTGELTANDYDADVIGELTIQPGHSSGTVTITTGTDNDAENERLALQAVKDGQMFTRNSDVSPHGARGEAVFSVEDAHEPGYVLTAVPSRIYESGNSATVSTLHFTPNYVREDVPVDVTLTSNHHAYSALFTYGGGTTGNSARLPVGGGSVTAQFQLVPERRAGCVCDGDRMNNEVEITATVTVNGVAEEVATTTVHVVDVHKLPEITVTAMTVSGAGPLMELAEGAKYKVRVEADRNDPSGEVTGETVTVSLALGDDSTAVAEDYRITPSSRRITGGLNDQSATFDLEVLGGDGDIGEETLVLDAMVKGGSTHGGGTENKGMLSVTLVDATTLNVEPRSDTEVELAVVKARNAAEGADDLWTYGDDDLSIKLADLFKLPADGFTVTADAVSADAKVVTAQADAGMVTVTAVGMGTTMVTVTATTAASGVQISPDIASVEFEVEVDELTRVFMVSGPDDMMNLVEGGEGAMVTVSTNIPVSENTEVMLMRDGSSSAGDDDYMLEPSLVTIMAGEMTGSTMVTATEDNMAEEMEMLTLFLVVDDMQMTDKSVSFYLWDAAVPALPVIAQLLLAAFLAIGGCRRYLRR